MFDDLRKGQGGCARRETQEFAMISEWKRDPASTCYRTVYFHQREQRVDLIGSPPDDIHRSEIVGLLQYAGPFAGMKNRGVRMCQEPCVPIRLRQRIFDLDGR